MFTAQEERQLKDYKCVPRHIFESTLNTSLLEGYRTQHRNRLCASVTPLPGSSASAIPAQSVRIKNYTVRPMKAGDWAILQKLDSPLIAQAIQAAQYNDELSAVDKLPVSDAEKQEKIAEINKSFISKSINISVEDMIVAVYLMTRPCKETYQLLESKGKAQVIVESMFELGGDVDMDLLSEMFHATQGQASKSFETKIQYSTSEGGEAKSFFPVFQAPLPTG